MDQQTKYVKGSNGQIREIASYSKGCRHGTTKWFFANGELERVAEFWYDQLHGAYYEFWPNGKLALKAYYTYGALEESEEYNETGELIQEKSEATDEYLSHHTCQDVSHADHTNTPNGRKRSNARNSMRRPSEYNCCGDISNNNGTG